MKNVMLINLKTQDRGGFLKKIPKAQNIKENIEKFNFIKLKVSFHQKIL